MFCALFSCWSNIYIKWCYVYFIFLSKMQWSVFFSLDNFMVRQNLLFSAHNDNQVQHWYNMQLKECKICDRIWEQTCKFIFSLHNDSVTCKTNRNQVNYKTSISLIYLLTVSNINSYWIIFKWKKQCLPITQQPAGYYMYSEFKLP